MIEKMRAIWCEIFELDTVDADADFFKLGGDSMAATVLMLQIEEAFGVTIEPTEIFEVPILEAFTERVAQTCALLSVPNATQ